MNYPYVLYYGNMKLDMSFMQIHNNMSMWARSVSGWIFYSGKQALSLYHVRFALLSFYEESSHFHKFLCGMVIAVHPYFVTYIPTLIHHSSAEKTRKEVNLLLHVAIWSQIVAMNVLMCGSQDLTSNFFVSCVLLLLNFSMFKKNEFTGQLCCKFHLRNAFIQLG